MVWNRFLDEQLLYYYLDGSPDGFPTGPWILRSVRNQTVNLPSLDGWIIQRPDLVRNYSGSPMSSVVPMYWSSGLFASTLARSALLDTHSCSVARLPHIQLHSHTFPHMYCVSLEAVFNSTSFGTLNCRSVCRVSLARRTLSRGSGQTDRGRSCHAYYLFRYKRETTWSCKTKVCRPTKVGHRWRRGGTRQTRYTPRYRGY
jgi:hypothetical protein